MSESNVMTRSAQDIIGQRAAGKAIEEILRKHELQYSVSEEFQPLIVKMMAVRLMAQTGMCQRFSEKQRIAKLVADPLFQRRRFSVFGRFQAK